jgi:nucleotide-binding universal stress UspA family protein
MSGEMVAVLVIAGVWLAIGVVLSVVMGRRGHFGPGWGILGAMLGPFAIVAAVASVRLEREEVPATIAVPESCGGPVDVLVGIDGSPESEIALEKVVTMLGPQLGRLTLATAIPFDDVPPHTTEVFAELDRHARLSGVPTAGEEVLHGQPARALAEFASENGYGLLAIGTRGQGLSKAVMGSTATELAAGCPVPLLMVSGRSRTSARRPLARQATRGGRRMAS